MRVPVGAWLPAYWPEASACVADGPPFTGCAASCRLSEGPRLEGVGMVRFFDNYLTTSAGKYINEACKNEQSDGVFRRFQYPRRESNPDYRFRKPEVYPLTYKGLSLLILSGGKITPASAQILLPIPASRFSKPLLYPLTYGGLLLFVSSRGIVAFAFAPSLPWAGE